MRNASSVAALIIALVIAGAAKYERAVTAANNAAIGKMEAELTSTVSAPSVVPDPS